jgi:hypothetical protein
MQRRGNPNWGKPAQLVPSSAVPTEFELRTRSLSLREDQYANSDLLRAWCKQNKNRCYVPEWLLKKWDMLVETNL